MSASTQRDRGVRDEPILIYSLIAIGSAVFVFGAHPLLARPPTTWAWGLSAAALLAVTARRAVFFLPLGRSFLSLAEPMIFCALLWDGAPLALAIAAADAVFSARPARHPIRSRALSLALMSVSVFAAAQVLEACAPLALRRDGALDRVVPAMLAAGLTHFLCNSLSVAWLAARRNRRSLWPLWWQQYAWAGPSYLAAASTALLIHAAAQIYGAIALAIGLPMLAMAALFYWSQAERLRADAAHVAQLESTNGQILDAFALAIEGRDPQARGHARRVQAYAELLAQRALDDPELRREVSDDPAEWQRSLSTAALIHDVGKLGLPDHLLLRRAALSEADAEKLREHTAIGAAMVARLRFAVPLAPIVRHHHERWDGTGYPDRLRGSDTPLAARIVALADLIDGQRRDRGDGLVTLAALQHAVAGEAGRRIDPRLATIYQRDADAIERELAARTADLTRSDAADRPGTEVHELEQVPQEAAAVFDLSLQLAASLDLHDTLSTALASLGQAIPHDAAVIYLTDESGSRLEPRLVAGTLGSEFGERVLRREEGLVGWVVGHREPVLHGDPQLELGPAAEAADPPVGDSLVAPLADRSGVVGAIAFYARRRERFDRNHLRLLLTVGPQIARAVRNAQLYEATRRTSMTDTLTGLPNSRALYLEVERELARATRRGREFCVVVMDLDGFKAVNDTWGHRAGDAVLSGVSLLLRRGFRAGDTLVRYAGDEFVALLPETSLGECQSIIERLQHSIAATPLALEDGQHVTVGISAGIACFPQDGATIENLIHRADKEMYRDKAVRAQTGHRPQAARA